MIRFFTLLIVAFLAELTFISCNGPNETNILQNSKSDSALAQVRIEPTVKRLESNNSNYNMLSEPAIVPVVIRSPVPPGSYGYIPDTQQVSQYIRCIFQDSKGNLWFGTVGDGVCRYDGKTLTYFTTREGCSGNTIQGILEDENGYLWIGTNGGLSKYDGVKFILFNGKEALGTLPITSIYLDRFKTIWVGTAAGIYHSNNIAKDEQFVALPIPEAAEKLEVKWMTADRTGNMWFATNGSGVYRYDTRQSSGEGLMKDGGNLRHFTEKEGLGHNSVHCILQDKNGFIWFATLEGLSRYDPMNELSTGNRSFINYTDKKGSNEVWRLFEDKAGNLWVVGRGSLRRYDAQLNGGIAQGTSLISFTAKDGLTNTNLQSIFEDRAGNFWLGSGAGLFRFDKNRTNHPCVKNTCAHQLHLQHDREEHALELSKSIINITKKGPWPQAFR